MPAQVLQIASVLTRKCLIAALWTIALSIGTTVNAQTPGAGSTWSHCYPATSQFPGFANGIRCDVSGSVSLTQGANTVEVGYPGGAATCAIAQGWVVCNPGAQTFCYAPRYPAPSGYSYGTHGQVCYPLAPQVDLTRSPSLLDWPEQLVSVASSAKTVTLTNGGGNQMYVYTNAFQVSAPFSVVQHTCGSGLLPAYSSCAVSVAFTPSQAVQYNGILQVQYETNGTYPVAAINLAGKGVTQYSGPVVGFQPSVFSFPVVGYGVSTGAYSFTVKNVGFSTLTMASVDTSGPEFAITASDCGAALAPDASCTVQVQFSPAAAGNRSGFLRVVSNSADSPSVLPFGGVGAAPPYNEAPLDDVNAGGDSGDHMGDKGGPETVNDDPQAKDQVVKLPNVTSYGSKCPPFYTCYSSPRPDSWNGGGMMHTGPREPGDRNLPGMNDDSKCRPTAEYQATSTKFAAAERNSALVIALADHGKNLVDPQSAFALDPIHTGTGNKVHQQTDYLGSGDPPLAFARTYNSYPFAASALTKHSFGPGWYSSVDRRVSTNAAGTTATVTRGDGKSYAFTKQTNGTWLPGNEIASTLIEFKDAAGTRTGWRYTTRHLDVEDYNASGRITAYTLRTGGTYAVTYDTQDRVDAVSSPIGAVLHFEYDTLGRVKKLIDPSNAHVDYTYDVKGRLSSVAYPDGRSRQYQYQNPNNLFSLTGVVDETGQAYVSFGYDTTGRATSNVFAGSVGQGTVAYAAGSTNSTTTTPDGTAWTRTFASYGGKVGMTGLTAACATCGNANESFAFDYKGLITSHTSLRGVTTTFTYNSRGLEVTKVEAVGTADQRTTTTTWHETMPVPLTITRGSTTTSYEYDSNGRVTAVSTVSGGQTRTTTYAYNAIGQLTQINGPRTDVSDTTTYSYNAQGNLATETNALGQTTTYLSYNTHRQALSILNPNGTISTFTYDARGRMLSSTEAGLTTTFTYNQVGLLESEVDPYGVTTTYLYDSAHRLYGKDRLGEKMRHTLDSSGRVIRTDTFDSLNLLSAVSIIQYDGLGRIRYRYLSNGSSLVEYYIYDAEGNVVNRLTDTGSQEASLFDSFGRRTRTTDALSGATNFGYSADDQLISVQDPRNVATTYVVSGLGNRTQVASPDSGTTTNTYDTAGNLLTSTDARGRVRTYTYDALNRVATVSYGDGTGATRTYDVGTNGVGRLSSVQDATGSTVFAYDAFGRIASKSQTAGGVTLTLTYGRDSLGRVTSLTYPSGRVAAFTYSGGRTSSIEFNGEAVVSDIQFFPFGGVESWIFGNGLEYTRYIDQDSRIARYLTSTGERRLTYGSASANNHYQVTNIENWVGGAVVGAQNFGYDAVGRLTSFAGYTNAGANQTQSLSYDSNGNRTSATRNGVTQTYSYTAGTNRIATITQGGQAIQSNVYDAAGDIVADGTKALTFDSNHYLASATVNGATTTYAYNNLGLRVTKSTAGGVTRFLYDEKGRLLVEVGANGQALQEFVWLGDTLVAVYMPQRYAPLTYVWTDHQGTPREITDSNNASLWKWESMPFGETPPKQNPSGLGVVTFNLRFPGQYFDAETGLSHNGVRTYDPWTGRYIQPDPIGPAGGTGVFTYALNSPLQYVDPHGMDPTNLLIVQAWLDKFRSMGFGGMIDSLCKEAAKAGIDTATSTRAVYEASKELCSNKGRGPNDNDNLMSACAAGLERAGQATLAGRPILSSGGAYYDRCMPMMRDFRGLANFDQICASFPR